MSATHTQGVTHDVGDRVTWTLRPAISTNLNIIVLEDPWKDDLPEGAPLPKPGNSVTEKVGKKRAVIAVISRQDRRKKMQDVCTSCRASGHVNGFYQEFDNMVDLYDDKFAKPATAIMNALYAAKKLTQAPMYEKLPTMSFGITRDGARAAVRRCPGPITPGETGCTTSRRRSIWNSCPK